MLSTNLPIRLLHFALHIAVLTSAQASGSGKTTRYWDCCKPSCAWPGKASVSSPVGICDKNNNPLADANAQSGCNGGTSFMCADQSPWAVSDSLAYGFAAVNIAGGSESTWCCACYELTFTSGPVSGKKMVVQATNTGGDLGSNQFDLAMPGGGLGIYDGCTPEWGTPAGGWGNRYGGVTSRSQCDSFPKPLQPGCYWRFDWFGNADNPGVTFKQVTCPAALTGKTGCVRQGESPTGPSSVGASTGTSPATTQRTLGTTTSSKPSTSTSVPTSGNTGGTATLYGQCGGQNWSGPTSCASGSTCQKQSDYYSQCLPNGSSFGGTSTVAPVATTNSKTTAAAAAASTTTTTTTTKSAVSSAGSPSSGTAKLYDQCGGQNWTGATKCDVGSSCQKQNDYYSQCLPDSSAQSSSSVSPRYGQCGGQTWTGPKACAAGSTCQKQNDYYSQCL